jgi:hypothetical protein
MEGFRLIKKIKTKKSWINLSKTFSKLLFLIKSYSLNLLKTVIHILFILK